MATHLLAHELELIPVPEKLTLEHAAAIPEVYLTAYDALFLQAGLCLGNTALLHSVGSGVGTAAVQLCRCAGVRTLGTARSRDKLQRAAKLGLDAGILVEAGKFADAVMQQSSGRGADVILDTVGAAYLKENLSALARRGRVVVIGLLGGASGELPLGALLDKRASLIGTVLRSRTLEEKAALAQSFARQVVPLFADGRLAPVIDDVLPFEQVAAAHQRMEENRNFGKLVLRW
jgi:NADPH:quinone reductase-like Zn-dependent oxidoreductase